MQRLVAICIGAANLEPLSWWALGAPGRQRGANKPVSGHKAFLWGGDGHQFLSRRLGSIADLQLAGHANNGQQTATRRFPRGAGAPFLIAIKWLIGPRFQDL
jgi:hypothetical protein